MASIKPLVAIVVVVCILMILIGGLYVGGIFQGDFCPGSCARIGNLCKCPQTMGQEIF